MKGIAIDDLIIIGGEHAFMVYEAALLSGQFSVVGFLDRQPGPWAMHAISEPMMLRRAFRSTFVVGIGTMQARPARRQLIGRLVLKRWASIIHPRAFVSPSATIGPGSVVMPGAIVNARSMIGHHCIINSGAAVEQDVRVGLRGVPAKPRR